MSRHGPAVERFLDANRVPLATAALVLAAFAALVIGWLVYNAKMQLVAITLSAPLVFLLAVYPRWALYQFVILLFVQVRLLDSPIVHLTDLSAALVVLAAAIDVLCASRPPAALPRLTGSFLMLLAAVSVCALFSADPAAAVNPLARISLLTLTFLSLHRLAARTGPTALLKLYFFTAAANAIIVLGQFIAASGAERAFGFSFATHSWLALPAFPIGLSFYLTAPRRQGMTWLLGCVLVLAGMVATQSRLPLIFAAMLAVLVIVLARRFTRRLQDGRDDMPSGRLLRGRVMALAGFILLGAVAVVAAKPSMFEQVGERFAQLLTLDPSGTVRLRLTLWGFALQSFFEHPLLGMGPGTFRGIQDLIPSLRLDRVSWWIRGLSAHNLFLHYLAETGIVGTTALTLLFVNLYRAARRVWQSGRAVPTAAVVALYALGILLLVTTFIEAGWMWGQSGFAMVLFAAVIARSDSPAPA